MNNREYDKRLAKLDAELQKVIKPAWASYEKKIKSALTLYKKQVRALDKEWEKHESLG